MNYAVRMYRKIGFEIVDENDEEYIMICKLQALASSSLQGRYNNYFCMEKRIQRERKKLLSDKLPANLGYLYENLAAQMIAASGRELYYHTWKEKQLIGNCETRDARSQT